MTGCPAFAHSSPSVPPMRPEPMMPILSGALSAASAATGTNARERDCCEDPADTGDTGDLHAASGSEGCGLYRIAHMRIFVAALALLAALGADAKTLRYASQFDPGTMDPHAIASLYNNRVLSQVYEALVGRDEQFRPEPRLALAWTPLDGGPRLQRFKLRPGVKFQDRRAVQCRRRRLQRPARRSAPTSAYKASLPGVTGARKVDDLTVDILTTQANPTLPLSLTNLRMMSRAWCLAHHVEKPQDYKAKEETYAARNAKGTGPFRLVSWEPDIKTVLAANPGYWGRHGNVTEAQYLVVTTAATRVSALISGEIDLVVDPAVQDLDRLRRLPGIKVAESTGLGSQFLGFDHARSTLVHGDAGGRNPFRDLRVREAIRAAIDVQALEAKVMRGAGATGRAMFSPVVDGFDKRFAAPAAFDLERAKALLRQAGIRQRLRRRPRLQLPAARGLHLPGDHRDARPRGPAHRLPAAALQPAPAEDQRARHEPVRDRLDLPPPPRPRA